MKNFNWKTPKGIAIISAAAVLVIALAVALVLVLGRPAAGGEIVKVPASEEYVYFNPDETKAEADEGMKIDGVLDEAVYGEKKWLYLSNDDAGNHVNIAMTSHFGEEGMYFVFDVTETSPIYVNPDRSPTLNSCIELYLVPPYVSKLTENSIFEIDLLPTGDIAFRKSDGKYGYINVTTTNDIMAYLGATTKGGEVNTPECYGYALELFIPWAYMERMKVDVDAIKDAYMLVNPAHITSLNYAGKNGNLDRYWYYYAQQIGTGFTEVARYFRFNGDGVMGTSPLNLENGEHYQIVGADTVLPGMQVPVTVVPDEGYAITSILVDGEERINKVAFDETGSITIYVRGTGTAQTVSAKAEVVSEGKKTLSGKICFSGMTGDSLKGVLVSYIGPTGEKPVVIDAEGKFELKDLEQGYYVLKVGKEGFTPLSRGIYLNQDIYTELTLKSSVFQVTYGACWILDDESEGVLYKLGGNGHIISNAFYNDFTLETYLRYDEALAEVSTADEYLQQRSGVRILFSNGKYWHIDLLRDNGKYYLQYAKISGDSSIFNWKNMYTLSEDDISKYVSTEGIKMTVKRAGNLAAIYLNDNLVVFEELDAEYSSLTAQVGMEAWVANSSTWKYPYSIVDSAEVERPPQMIFRPADSWDISSQHEGIIRKHGIAGNITWLESAINSNDITTVARDLSPDTRDYCMIYIFQFSNGEQFRVRLNHTDNDGKYRIQSMAGGTLFADWKNHYTLTDAEAQKVQNGGISYRVQILGTTAYVYLEGKQVCTYDLSVVVATGKPSGIENTTVKVALRLDGNFDQITEIPFTLVELKGNVPADPNKSEKPDEPDEPEPPVDPSKTVKFTIPNLQNGTIELGKASYALGEKVTLKITPAIGYVQKLYINGKPLMMDWKSGSCSFYATEESYVITGSFEKSLDLTPLDANRWDSSNHAHGILNAYYPVNNDAWFIDIKGEYASITVKAKNYWSVEDSKDGINGSVGYATILRVTLDNGKNYAFRVYNDKGTYAFGWFAGGGSATGWGGWKNIHDAYAADFNGDGVDFKLERTAGDVLTLSINGTVVGTYTMSGVTAANKVVSVGIQHNGNKGEKIEIPFELG